MEHASRGRQPLAISILLGTIAAAVAWLLISASSRAEDVNLTTADLVPQDAAVYVGLNTDLDSSEWISAFSLVEKLGREDPEAELRSLFEEEDVDWDEDVVPFLGGNAAFYLRSYDWSGDFPAEYGVIVRAKDPETARNVFLTEWDTIAGEESSHDGQAYLHFISEGEPGYIATIGDHLVLTTTEDEMRRVIDVAHSKEPSLADHADFKELRDELTRNFLAFVYVDPQRLLEGFFMPGLMPGMDEGVMTTETGAAAFVVGAKDSGFVFQSATGAIPAEYAGMLEPHESRFVKMVPSDTAVFVAAHGIGEAIALALETAEQQFGTFDESFWDDEMWEDEELTPEERAALEELFAEEDPFGGMGGYFGDAAEVARLLAGEVAVAVWLRDGEPQGVVMAEIEDEAAVRETIDDFLGAGDFASVTTEDHAGVTLTIVGDSYDDPVAFGIRDGVLYAGTLEGVKTVLDGVISSLADSPRFKAARDDLGVSLASFGYIDLQAFFATGELDAIPGLDHATETLQAVLITYVEERGVARMAGIVTIED